MGARENEENPVITKAVSVKKVWNKKKTSLCSHCYRPELTSSFFFFFFFCSCRRKLLSPAGGSAQLLPVMVQRTVSLQTPLQVHSRRLINHDVVDPLKTVRALPHRKKRLELQQGRERDEAGREQHLLRILPAQPQLIHSVTRHQNSRKKQSRKEQRHRDRLTCKGN